MQEQEKKFNIKFEIKPAVLIVAGAYLLIIGCFGYFAPFKFDFMGATVAVILGTLTVIYGISVRSKSK